MTPKPIDKQNPIKEKKYFLFGILNLQNGTRIIKRINILKDPANIGGNEVFKVSLFTGYELPKINMINNTNK